MEMRVESDTKHAFHYRWEPVQGVFVGAILGEDSSACVLITRYNMLAGLIHTDEFVYGDGRSEKDDVAYSALFQSF